MKNKKSIVKKLESLNYSLNLKRDSNSEESEMDYIISQIQILHYFLSKQDVPESIENELLEMYDTSLRNCKIVDINENVCTIDEIKRIGAADILSWILDIPKKAHKKNKKAGALINVI